MEKTEMPSMSNRQIKPLSRDALFEWATVVSVPNRDTSRQYQLVYKTSKSRRSSNYTKVSLRLYGYLGAHTFQTYGNWTG